MVHPTKTRQNLRSFWKLMNLQECVWETRHRQITKTILQEKVRIHYSTTIWCTKGLDIFLTMKVLENTPAVLSLGKLCDENGYSYEWINGQKQHLIKDGIRIICNTENFVPIVVPGLSSSSSGSSSSSRTLSNRRVVLLHLHPHLLHLQ